MERKQFLETLTTVAPALAANDLIPVMQHFWFTGDKVMAFNDQIAISTPCKTSFKGAVPGALLDFMRLSKAKEVTLEVVEKDLMVKAASSRVKLGILDPEAFIFEMPEHKGSDALKVKVSEFLDAIGYAMRSVSHDTSIPDQLGVTLIAEKDSLHVFSTNGATMTHAIVKMSGAAPFKKRVILSAPFCERMLQLAKNEKKLQLEVHDDHSLLVCGDALLFGRLIESAQPLDFIGVLDTHFPMKHRKQFVDIPTKLQLILERAIVIGESKTDRTRTQITVRDGKMRFFTASERGEVSDTMLVGEAQPQVDMRVEARHLKSGYGDFDRMVVTDKCAVMMKDNKMYLVSASA